MQSDFTTQIAFILFVFVVFVLLFLLLRSINLWYFRINTIVNNQERNNQLLTNLLEHFKQEQESVRLSTPQQPTTPEKKDSIFGNRKTESFKDKKVAVSGKFPVTIPEFQKQLESEGAIFQISIDVDSDYLITGKNPTYGDIQAARANNIKILTFDQYVDNTRS